jgi:hypothetical protein
MLFSHQIYEKQDSISSAHIYMVSWIDFLELSNHADNWVIRKYRNVRDDQFLECKSAFFIFQF